MIADIFITIINLVVSSLGFILDGLLLLLPNSPFKFVLDSSVSTFLPYVNWLLPVPEALAICQAWLVSITSFYVIQIALRWLKAIE